MYIVYIYMNIWTDMYMKYIYIYIYIYIWTHGLIAQLVRVSKQNSVVVGSNSLRPTFYSCFKESVSGEYHTPTHIKACFETDIPKFTPNIDRYTYNIITKINWRVFCSISEIRECCHCNNALATTFQSNCLDFSK